jgi:hypothetical protein
MSKAAELAKWGEVSTNGQVSGRRNIVINGAMNVAQRATQVTALGAADGYHTLDRWNMEIGDASAGRFTMDQIADGPSGFANALKLTTTTADTSIAAGEFLKLEQRFEGQDLQQFKKGTSDAEKVTVSFYVKGDAAATYTCELEDVDNTRSINQAFAVTTSWTRVILTFAADTSDPLGDDANNSLQLNFWLHGGTTYSGGTFVSNAWKDIVENTRMAESHTSIFDTTNRTFFITGVQMEVGSVATPFEHRSYGEELALCQRYFEVFAPIESQSGSIALNRQRLDTNTYNTTIHYIQKRATPTLTANYDIAHKPGVTYDSVSSLSMDVSTGEINSAQIGCSGGTDHSNTVLIFLGKATGTGIGKITIDAEL